MSERTIIEVNGVKLEVDLRHARRIEEIRIGDRVKVLRTEGYTDKSHKVYAGTVVGFEPFEKLPTVIVAYLQTDWHNVGVQFVYFNAQTKDVEIIKAIDDDQLDVNKADILAKMDREIQRKRDETTDLAARRAYFLAQFRAYWEPVNAKEET